MEVARKATLRDAWGEFSSVTDQANATQYKLVFEGPADDSAETLRLIKGIFLIDLSLSVEQAQQILSQVPSVILSVDSAIKAAQYQKKLSKAGAKILVVAPEGSAPPAEESPSETEGLEMEMSLDGNSTEDGYAIPEPRVYELPEEEAPDLESLIEESESIIPPTLRAQNPIIEPQKIDTTLSFDKVDDQG